MNLKELFGIKQPLSNLGTNKFRLSLDKEFFKTPHFVIEKVLQILETKPHLINGLRQLVRFILNEIQFTSKDEKSIKFMNEWADKREMYNELFNFTLLLIGCGTAYTEPIKGKTKGGFMLDNLLTFPDPSIVYKNLRSTSDDDYWIVQVPMTVMEYNDKKIRLFPIHYINGSRFFKKMVWGFEVNKYQLQQYTFGWSRTRDYGWGLLNSAIDNEDTSEEILKNWALIAKYRSLGKKIIGFYNESGEPVDMGELDRIRDEFADMEEEDSLLINKKFVSEDLAFTGTDNLMQNELEFLRKSSGGALTPNFMTAFSQDSSMATAAEAKVPFALEINALQKELERIFNNMIVEPLKKENSFLKDDLKLILKAPNLYSRNENFMNVSQLYNMRAATFNELRMAGGLEGVEGGDLWGAEAPLDKITVKQEEPIKENFSKVMKEKLNFSEDLKKDSLTESICNNVVFAKADDKSKKERMAEAVHELFRKK